MVYRPPSDAVTIGTPLADRWWVGQGGRAELINYHSLVIDIGGGRYLMMGHPRQDSITVRVGDRVREGQPIARVGNSGHSSAPHLHIQAQTLPIAIGDIRAIDLPQMLRTLRTYPLLFRDAGLVRCGVGTRSDAIDPRRGDLIAPDG